MHEIDAILAGDRNEDEDQSVNVADGDDHID